MDQPTELKQPEWMTPELKAELKRIEYEYHVRAFGEEMARVNFLPEKERMEYLYDMIDHAVAKGVKFDRPARGVS